MGRFIVSLVIISLVVAASTARRPAKLYEVCGSNRDCESRCCLRSREKLCHPEYEGICYGFFWGGPSEERGDVNLYEVCSEDNDCESGCCRDPKKRVCTPEFSCTG